MSKRNRFSPTNQITTKLVLYAVNIFDLDNIFWLCITHGFNKQ